MFIPIFLLQEGVYQRCKILSCAERSSVFQQVCTTRRLDQKNIFLYKLSYDSSCVLIDNTMKLIPLFRSIRSRPIFPTVLGSLQMRSFQPDFVPRDPNAKPKRYKYPAFYDPYGPRPPPSDKIVQLADKIAALPPEERNQIGPALIVRTRHPKMQQISGEGIDTSSQGGAAGAAKAEEIVEKTAFDVKLEKFDTAAKIKVIKEVRTFTSLGLKEAKELVEKTPVVLKQGITKEEANDIIGKLKAAGATAVME